MSMAGKILLCVAFLVGHAQGSRIDSSKLTDAIELSENEHEIVTIKMDQTASTSDCDGREYYINALVFGMTQCTSDSVLKGLIKKDVFTFEAMVNGEEVFLGQSAGLLSAQAKSPLKSFRISQQFCVGDGDESCDENGCQLTVSLRVTQHAWWGYTVPCGEWNDDKPVNALMNKKVAAHWEHHPDFPYHHASLTFHGIPTPEFLSGPREVVPLQAQTRVPDFIEDDNAQILQAEEIVFPDPTLDETVERDEATIEADKQGAGVTIDEEAHREQKCQTCYAELCEFTDIAATGAAMKKAITGVCETQGCATDCPDVQSWPECRGAPMNCQEETLTAMKAAKNVVIKEALTAWVAREKDDEEAAQRECAYFRTQTSCGIKQKWDAREGAYGKVKTKSSSKRKWCENDCTGKKLAGNYECSLEMTGTNSGDMGFIHNPRSSCKLGAPYWLDAKLKGTLTEDCKDRWSVCDPYEKDPNSPGFCPPKYGFIRGVTCMAKRKPHVQK